MGAPRRGRWRSRGVARVSQAWPPPCSGNYAGTSVLNSYTLGQEVKFRPLHSNPALTLRNHDTLAQVFTPDPTSAKPQSPHLQRGSAWPTVRLPGRRQSKFPMGGSGGGSSLECSSPESHRDPILTSLSFLKKRGGLPGPTNSIALKLKYSLPPYLTPS